MDKRYRAGANNTHETLYRGTWNMLELIERCGGKVDISGLEHFRSVDGPVIFVGNHMSTVETTLLPCIIMPTTPVTFIVKNELLEMPIYSSSVKIIDCIGVTRTDPIADFKTILNKGLNHIDNGTSVVVFPQTTRTTEFDPEKFGTVGIKLAKRAGIPVIPVAVKTDFLGNGKLFKDLGPIDKKKTVHIKFGPAVTVEGNGRAAHQEVINFIKTNLDEWHAEEEK